MNVDKDIYKRGQRKKEQRKVKGRGREKIVLYDKFAHFSGNLKFAIHKKINPVGMSRTFDVRIREVTFLAYSYDALTYIHVRYIILKHDFL